MTPTITRETYPAHLAQLWALTSLIEDAPLAEMLAAAEHADSVGAILDPTLYREKAPALHEDLTVLRALRQVQTTLAGMRGRRAGR